jgi:glycopeptide antibiotics resistance protein
MGWFLFVSIESTNRNTYFNKREIHLVPFKNTCTSLRNLKEIASFVSPDQVPYYRYLFIRNIVGNIIVLIPWGLLVPLLFQKLGTFKAIVITTVLFSFFIESTQYIFLIGVFDIDDIIYNTTGAIIGFYLLQVFKIITDKFFHEES